MILHESPEGAKPKDARSLSGTDALRIVVILGAFLLASVYMLHMLDRGWVPHDEGLLAQSAERVLSGQVPHRDFDEAYTGGLSYLNALAFHVWGISLMSLRMMLFVFFVAWVPCFYYCASRLLAPFTASVVTLTAVAWGPPNYAAAVPSWYNLFFATAVMAAVFRFLEVRSHTWLFIAGVLAGTSCLFKVVGLYSIASVLLFLLFYQKTETETHFPGITSRSSMFQILVIASMALFALALWRLIQPRFGPAEAIHFLLPGLLIAWLVAVEEDSGARVPVWLRINALVRLVVPFCVGVLLPIALFLLVLAASGASRGIWVGLAEQPLRRLAGAAAAPPPVILLIPSVCLAIGAFLSRRGRAGGVVMPGAVALLLAFLLAEASQPYAYQLAWQSFYGAPPIVTALGVLWLRTPMGRSLPQGLRQQVVVALSSLALFTLIQFPFSRPIYFCYVAPLLFLAVAAVIRAGGFGKGLGGPLTAFALAFAVLRVTPGFIYNMGVRPAPDEQRARLSIPRAAGLRVTKAEADEYSALVRLVQAHSPPGSTILAMPDSPEVYFLTQRQNPSRIFFDFFDAGYPDPERALQVIKSQGLSLIVFNERPAFSGAVDQRVLDEAGLAYPRAANVGRFTVRWK